MREPRKHLPGDLKALRYLDALNAGDLEAVAELWEEAAGDSDLEQMLTELDAELSVEQAGTKRLPGWHPTVQPQLTRRLAVVVAALAAACLLAVLAWPRRGRNDPVTRPDTNPSANRVARPPSSPPWREARRTLDETESAPFTWPLRNTLTTSIPPELFD
jgi:hypothetical protein